MPAIQTSYSSTMRAAFAGMKADMTPEVIVTRQIETAGGIGFGLAVAQGTGDRQVRLGGTGTFIGVTLVDPVANADALTAPTTIDQYPTGDIAEIMVSGTVWVLADGAVTAGAAATVTRATGRLGAKAVSAGTIDALPNAYFATSAADGALAVVHIR